MIVTNSQLRKVINEELQIVLLEQRMELWEQRTTRDLDILLNEIDVKGAAAAAMQKINDFALKLSIQAMNFITKGKKGALRAVKVAAGAIKRIKAFAQKHPKLIKFAIGILGGIIVYAVGSLLDPATAQAAIEMGGQVLTDNEFSLLKGFLMDADLQGVVTDQFDLRRSIDVLEAAQASGDVVPLEELGRDVASWLESADAMVKSHVAEAPEGVDTQPLMDYWEQLGQQVRVQEKPQMSGRGFAYKTVGDLPRRPR
tara:strand:- start:78 stop:845 length:768 start_codon:yes stop_codon:yes gene_type:complete